MKEFRNTNLNSRSWNVRYSCHKNHWVKSPLLVFYVVYL